MGEVMTMLCTFTNAGSAVFNVTAVVGGLHSLDYATSYHNFTGQWVGELVDEEGERTVEYRVFVPYMPRAMDLKLMAHVLYLDTRTGVEYAETFLNQTVAFVEAHTTTDIRTVLPYVLGAATTLAAIYIISPLLASGSGAKRTMASSDDAAAGGATDAFESILTKKPASKKEERSGSERSRSASAGRS